MRFVIPAAAALLFAAQVQAQTTTTTPAPTTTAPATPSPATPAPTTPAPDTMAPGTSAPAAAAPSTTPPTGTMMPKKTVHRQTLQQRFDASNTTHDGHLTKDQATAAKWGYVTSHFSAMDKDNKGYVTMDDIHAYAKMHHASRAKKPATTPAAAPAPSNG